MQKHLKNLTLLNKDVNFYVPSAAADSIVELGRVVKNNQEGLVVRSYVDGEKYNIYVSDIVGLKNKGINKIWQIQISIRKNISTLFKKK